MSFLKRSFKLCSILYLQANNRFQSPLGAKSIYTTSVYLSNAVAMSKKRKLSERLKLYTPETRPNWSLNVPSSEVLVMFFPFLGAQESHKKRYLDFYLSQGVDVLSIDSNTSDFLWPPNSAKFNRHILDIMDQHCDNYKHIIFHTMSIGSYNMTTLRMLATETQSPILQRLRGLVYDSIVVGSGKGNI